MLQDTEAPFRIHRLGIVMEEDPENPDEAWGVLNPACARSASGELYLFPRIVGDNNYSRIGIAKVIFNEDGDPCGVQRLGYALEPTESFEGNAHTAGVEDPRVTFVEALGVYVMTYTAYGPLGPRVALAVSEDLLEWRRLGLAKFSLGRGVDFDFYTNKDALIFPGLIADPEGRPSIAMIHRPTYDLSLAGGLAYKIVPKGVRDQRPSMWISYSPIDRIGRGLEGLTWFSDHQLLAEPQEPWEELKIGGGTPPVLTDLGWLVLFHGVSGEIVPGVDIQPNVHYSAGALVLDREDPTNVLYRSRAPILEPETELEREGIVSNVVFPTAIDDRGDRRMDVYYGMADSRIGAGKLLVPSRLPSKREAELVA